VADKLYFFIDSGWSMETTTHAGEVVISEIAFSGEATGGGDPVDPTPDPTPVLPELPTDGEYVKFVTENAYTIIADGEYVNKVQITYTEISTNTWHNVNTYVADKAAGKTNLSVTLRNNGTTTVLVTVKLEAAGAAELASQKVELAAGEMKTVSLDFTGEAQMLFFFIDSDWSETTTTNAGDISIAGIKFSGEATPPAVDPDPTPVAPELPTDGGYVKFAGNECYTIIAEAEYSNVVQFTYAEVSDNTYQNVNTWIKDKAEGKTNLAITIRNNGTEAVKITVKLEAAGAVGIGEQTVVIAAGEMQTVYIDFAGEAELLYLFIDSGWSETTSAHSGDITVGGIKFQ
jgi:LEA14-like dessication related protein